MATKLGLYNAALREIGELNLGSLTEGRESRRVLDQVYDDGFINTVLEEAPWKFATRSVKLGIDSSVTPAFGYKKAFLKPSDFVVIAQVCSDEYYNTPLLQYSDEGNYFYSDLDSLYIQYVSNGSSYGGDLSKWPQSFYKFVSLLLAVEIVERLTQNATKYQALYALMLKAKIAAKSKDAMKNPTKFLPEGNWASARSNTFSHSRRDLGYRGQLIG